LMHRKDLNLLAAKSD